MAFGKNNCEPSRPRGWDLWGSYRSGPRNHSGISNRTKSLFDRAKDEMIMITLRAYPVGSTLSPRPELGPSFKPGIVEGLIFLEPTGGFEPPTR